ncbi:MAG: hypothetical protein ACRCXQ_09835 [Vagococcus fluvialis]
MKKIKGIKEITLAWKNFEVEVKQEVLIDGKISGTFKGELKPMKKEKQISNNELLKILNFKFEDIRKDMDKGFREVNKKIEIMDKKIDLILATPTMQREIDHEELSKLLIQGT